MDITGIRKLLREFGKSVYGKTVFLLAYIIPFILLIASIVIMVVDIFQQNRSYSEVIFNLICLFVVTFVLANIYYYTELRKYCEYKQKNNKK